MEKAIKDILIVGGGSAGWMAAAFLSRAFKSAANNNFRIRLLESSDIDTVGVGEGSIPIFGDFFRYLGIRENVWMKKCNASFKLAIRFNAWLEGKKDEHYWHTFGTISPNIGPQISLMQYWLHQRLKGDFKPFAEACKEAVALCNNRRAPKSAYELPKPPIPYAFHLDAGLLANFLKEYALKKGVEHIVDTVEEVQVDSRNFIQGLKTKNTQNLSADFYIDCSGFSSLLMEKALKEPWVSDAESLFCDRAVVISRAYAEDDPYDEKNGGLKPYTSATALAHGWAWETPLISRAGNGYVYSSRFASETEAEQTFRAHLQLDKAPAKHLKMRLGKTKRLFVNNCLALGLSGGFIEPLESTGLALVQVSLNHFIHNFPDKDFSPALQTNYNRVLNDYHENIRDFIILHYCLTKREDTPFWKAVKEETLIPESLQIKLNTWKTHWPNDTRFNGRIFNAFNYCSILAGMNFFPKKTLPILEFNYGSNMNNLFQKVEKRSNQLLHSLPKQAEFFKQIERLDEFRKSEW